MRSPTNGHADFTLEARRSAVIEDTFPVGDGIAGPPGRDSKSGLG
jgi:hypothetical protein